MLLLMAGISLQAGTKSPYSELIASLPDEDPDQDGLTNQEEAEAGIDPTKWDTDGDGKMDGEDGWALDSDLRACHAL